MKLIWVDTGNGIRVVPAAENPVQELRGLFKGLNLTQELLKDRKEERERERQRHIGS